MQTYKIIKAVVTNEGDMKPGDTITLDDVRAAHFKRKGFIASEEAPATEKPAPLPDAPLSVTDDLPNSVESFDPDKALADEEGADEQEEAEAEEAPATEKPTRGRKPKAQ